MKLNIQWKKVLYGIALIVIGIISVSYTHLTLPTT